MRFKYSELFQVQALTFVQADKPKHKKKKKEKSTNIYLVWYIIPKHLRSITYLKTIIGKYLLKWKDFQNKQDEKLISTKVGFNSKPNC